MKHHLLCLTIDADPDGMSGRTYQRTSRSWHGLAHAQDLPQRLETLAGKLGGRPPPVTWFVRADGQLRNQFGSSLYLLEEFSGFWHEVAAAGHELGWHTHLYKDCGDGAALALVDDPKEACDRLSRLWEELRACPFGFRSFRNGEAWHFEETLNLIETLGIACDSTAVPGRSASHGHPSDWRMAPNRPYFPQKCNIQLPGPPRGLIELPMTTWRLQTTYDDHPKVRYMNPAIHEHYFVQGVSYWQRTLDGSDVGPCAWVLVIHPDEMMPQDRQDLLYAFSPDVVCRNLVHFVDCLGSLGHTFEFVTMAEAAARCRDSAYDSHSRTTTTDAARAGSCGA